MISLLYIVALLLCLRHDCSGLEGYTKGRPTANTVSETKLSRTLLSHTQGKPILESKHAITGFIGLGLLAIQAMLPRE